MPITPATPKRVQIVNEGSSADLFAQMAEARQEHEEARRRAAEAAAAEAERQATAEGMGLYLALSEEVGRVESQGGWVTVAVAAEDGGLSGAQRAELQARLGRIAVSRGWATE